MSQTNEGLPVLSIEELLVQVTETIDTIQADMDVYDERISLQTPDDGKTTTERAREALQRQKRFSGEHAVARAWLKDHDPNGHFFRKT